MRLRTALTALLLGVAIPASAHAQQAIDWDALRDETVRVLQAYLRVDTSNPPGNELAAARFLKEILEREGIEAQILDTAELRPAGRANLYARLRGTGAKRAIALVHHMDVVPAAAADWSAPPFAGELRDGFVYGRGTLDMKGEGIAYLMALIALKRSGVPLARDIVYIGNADEEDQSSGAAIFVRRHADLLRDVEFLLTEGGDNEVEAGRLKWAGVSVSEKRTFWQRLTVRGTASHGSRPTPNNPVPRLLAAVARIAAHETPLHVTPAVARYFADVSRTYTGEQKKWLADVRAALAEPRARAWILRDPYWNAVLRNTVTPTVLRGGPRTNVIPSEAAAELDVRLLPDQDPEAMRGLLVSLAADTAVHFETIVRPKPPLESPIDTDLFRAIERAVHERAPGAFVTTPMLTGGTDRPAYRALGIVTYGIDPFLTEAADAQRGVHGVDERVSVESLAFGVRFIYDVLRYVQ